MFKVEKWNLRIIKFGIYLCLFIPLMVGSRFVFPYVFPKVAAFRLIVEVILFFYLILAMQNSSYRPRLSIVGYLLLLYVVILFLASAFGVNFYRSFWSNTERSDGLVSIFHFLIFFIILISVFKERDQWYRFFNYSIIASFLVSLYALGQRLNLSFLVHTGEARLSATVGNASFLAAYLIFNIVFAAILFTKKKEIGWRIFYCLTLLLEIYILYNTQTRGAVLSFFAGLIVFVVFSTVLSRNKKIKRLSLASFLLIICLVALILFNASTPWVKNNPTLGRIVSISSKDITTQARLLTWQASWQGWREHFWLGWGYENYNIVFNKYFPAGLILDIGSRVWYDRSHNIIFDVGVTSGIIGLLSYLSILISAIYLLWLKYRKNQQDYYLYIFLIILIIVYFGQNFFVFDTPSTYLMFFSTLAFINFLVLEKQANAEQLPKSQINNRQLGLPVILIFIFIISFAAYLINIKPILANSTCIDAVSIEKQGQANERYKEIESYFEKSFSYQTYQNAEFRQYFADFIANKIRDGQIPEADLAQMADLGIAELKKSIEEEPNNVRHYIYLMTFYNSSFKFDKSRLDSVIEFGNKAIPLSPTRPHIYYEMAQAYVFKGDFNKAIDYFEKGLALNDNVVDFHWSLAATYILADREKEAEEEFNWMAENLNFKYNTTDNLQRLIRVYAIKKNFVKLAELYNKLISLDPNKADYHAKLAAVYAELGDKEKAVAEVKKAEELDLSYVEEGEKFLQSLQNPTIK